MKAKNEEEFTYMRVKKDCLYKLRELNARDKQKQRRSVKIYETLENIVIKELNPSIL